LKKKVRYLVGAIGAAPALGLMVPAAATAAQSAPKAAKTVSLRNTVVPDVSCTANVGNHTTHSGTTLKFYSKAEGTRTCIGTIEGSSTLGTGTTFVAVHTVNGSFCSKEYASHKITEVCRAEFTRDDLSVFANGFSTHGPILFAYSEYPFKHNGF
jgi:hypothetical protein